MEPPPSDTESQSLLIRRSTAEEVMESESLHTQRTTAEEITQDSIPEHSENTELYYLT